jgi:hypothetical protein
MNNFEVLKRSVRPEPVEGLRVCSKYFKVVTVHGSTGCAYAVGANAPYSYGLPLAGTPRTVEFFGLKKMAERA